MPYGGDGDDYGYQDDMVGYAYVTEEDEVALANVPVLSTPTSLPRVQLAPAEAIIDPHSYLNIPDQYTSGIDTVSTLGHFQSDESRMRWKTQTAEQVQMEAELFKAHSCSLDDAIDLREDVQWLLRELIPQGGLTVVGGRPKVARKSLTLMGLALNIINPHLNFLGIETCHGDCVFINLEDGFKRIIRRMYNYGYRKGMDKQFGMFDMKLFPTNSLLFALPAYIYTYRPTAVFIDPLVELSRLQGMQDENSSSEMSAILGHWRTLAQESGTAIIVVHHYRKDGDVMRGSSAIQGCVDAWWDIRYMGRDAPLLLQCTSRDAEESELEFRVLFEKGLVTLSVESDIRHFHSSPKTLNQLDKESRSESHVVLAEQVERYLTSNPDRFVSQRELCSSLSTSRPTLKRVLDMLEQDGVIERGPNRIGARIVPNVR